MGIKSGTKVIAYPAAGPLAIAAPTGSRPLYESEKNALGRFFGNSLDVEAIVLGYTNYARPHSLYGGSIKLPRSYFIDSDPCKELDLSRPYHCYSRFVHEALHVWQRQHGEWVTGKAAFLQVLYTTGLYDPYRYDGTEEDPVAMLNNYLEGNVERQGQIFEDYVLRKLNGACADSYVLVQEFIAGNLSIRRKG